MEFTLLWAALTAFAAAWITIRLTRPAVPDRPVDRVIGAAVAGIAVGRVAAVLMQGTNPLTNPGELLIIRGGVDTVFASLAGVAVLAWPLRRVPASLDALAPAVLAALAGWHGGCLWRSTCLGTASDLPWAWALPGSDVTRHPVEIYAATLLLAGLWTIVTIKTFTRHPGTAAAMAVFWSGLARLATEPFRPGLGASLSWFYALATVAGLIAAGLFGVRSRRLTGKAAASPYPPG
ncbi:MAG TPA: prolipoprotein diacylglyceryl transferase family protein [Acidimicrobiia bacterium]|nr:prolipoprotein diacylglyceryl transferase family protein [Acidimicrobiia bacterium]